MKINTLKLTQLLIINLCFISLASIALATPGKVIKAKGKQVLIELPLDPKLRAGDTIELDTVELKSPSALRMREGGARTYTFGGGGDLELFSKTNGNGNYSALTVNGRYGWNMAKFEYGPFGTLTYYATDSSNSVRVLGFGGYFDFNLVPNNPGVEAVYGIGGDVMLYLNNATSNSTSVNTTGFGVDGGAFYKYFLFRSDICIRGDAQLHIFNYSASTNYIETGVRFLLGIQNYF